MKQAKHFVVPQSWKIMLIDIGINPAEVLALAKLPKDLFSRQGAKITPTEYFQTWRAVEELAGVDDLPLKFGQAVTGITFDPPIFAGLCSRNLNEGLERLALMKRLIGPVDLTIDISAKETEVKVRFYGYEGKLPASAAALELVFLTAFARLGSRQMMVPRKLTLPNPPLNQARYLDFFGRKITASHEVKIAFEAEDCSRPFLTENKIMLDYFELGLKKKLAALDGQAPLGQRVKSILLQLLPSGNSSIEQAAAKLAMSPRTLQRHLAKESIHYKDILNETRRELAEHYLTQVSISNDEISYLLGYQDTSSFLRAFKDWTGKTPGQYRKPLLENTTLH